MSEPATTGNRTSPTASPPARGASGFDSANSRPSPLRSSVWAARLLLEALESGQNIDVLTGRLGIPRDFVARCARRLVDQGVWQDGRTVCEWKHERQHHAAFWMDVAVAEGKLCRRIDQSGRCEWSEPGRWRAVPEPGNTEGRVTAPRATIPIRGPIPDSAAPSVGQGSGPRRAIPSPPEHDPLCGLFPDAEWLW